jgi:hypothetical protein
MFRKCGLEREKIGGLGREVERYIEVENGGIKRWVATETCDVICSIDGILDVNFRWGLR